MDKNIAFCIGRFQLFNKAQLKLIKEGLTFNKLIIFLGSANVTNEKNPYSAKEREEMIRLCLSDSENKKAIFIPLNDYESDQLWVDSIISQLSQFGHKEDITLVGTEKDLSSYYLKLFPFDVVNPDILYDDESIEPISSTRARFYLKNKDKENFKKMVPLPIYEFFSVFLF